MKINELIRKFRKEQNLTQEQVANYLGVTAPAVNKWENGVSYPDITLLAPLARVLQTDVDTLLSFREELTDIEINAFIKEISEEVSAEGYEAVFEKVNHMIREYPNCDKLVLYSAQIMNGYLAMKIQDIIEKEKYENQIKAWLEAVAFGDDKELANMAVITLSQNYIASENYEEAQRLLDQIPPVGFDKRITQAGLYIRQGEYDKAYEVYEGMVYQNANLIISIMLQLIEALCKQEEYDAAMKYAEIIRAAEESFELGRYNTFCGEMMIYLEKKEKKKSLELLEELVDNVDTLYSARESCLYRHMKFKEDTSSDVVKLMLKKGLESDNNMEFIRQTPQFERIIKKLG